MGIQMYGTTNPNGGGQPQQQAPQQPQYAPQQPPQYQEPQYQQAPVQAPVQSAYQPQQQQQAPTYQPQYQPQAPVQQQAPAPVYGQPPVQAPVAQPQVGTADTVRDQVVQFIKTAGLTPSQVEQEFAALGGITESTRQALVRKHGEGTTNLLVQSMTSVHAQTQATLNATNNAIYSQVEKAFAGIATAGDTGQQSWNELSQWVQTNVDVSTRGVYNEMLKAGGKQAEMAVTEMINTFKASNGVGQSADLITGNQGGAENVAAGVADMTIALYTKTLNELVEKHGYESPQVTQLNATREAARARGIN